MVLEYRPGKRPEKDHGVTLMKRFFALTTLALLLGSCADNTANTGSGASTSGAAATPATSESAAAPDAASGAPAITTDRTSTLVIQRGSDIPTLDPGTVYDTSSGELLENVYEPLVQYKGTSLTDLEGLLATDWKMNDAGTEYRFTLRPDVKFHTGNPFTCADAEYTFRRNLVTNTSDSGNWFLTESLLGTGSNANDDPSITWDKISSAVKCDGETLVFTLPKADPAFLAKLAFRGQSIVDSKHAIEIGEWDGTEKTWKEHVGKDINASPLAKSPSGTGPYSIVSSDSTGVTFKANDNYWGGAPSICLLYTSPSPRD